MSSHTTICAKTVCANNARINELKLEQSVNSFADSSFTQSDYNNASTKHLPVLTLLNTHTSETGSHQTNGPLLTLQNKTSDSIAVEDSLGLIQFTGVTSSNIVEFASINGLVAETAVPGSEEGKLEFNCASAGNRAICMTITGGATDATDSVVNIPGILTGYKFQTETVFEGVDPAPTAAESGKAFIVPNIGATTITLPAVAAGLTFKVLFSAQPVGILNLIVLVKLYFKV